MIGKPINMVSIPDFKLKVFPFGENFLSTSLSII